MSARVSRLWSRGRGALILGALAGWLAGPSSAAVLTTTSSGYWTNPATWGGSGPPGDNDQVTINGGFTVTSTVSSASLLSLTITNKGNLVFSGWSSILTAVTVNIASGQVTHLPQSATTTNGAGEWEREHRVYIVCTNLTIGVPASINVARKGYQGGSAGGGLGPGGGAGGLTYGGGGYGGAGGISTGNCGLAYGSLLDPEDPGSGGGGGTGLAGGGAVRILAADEVLIGGSIIAGANAWCGHTVGGGSGGSIYISSRTIHGSGTVMADGDNHYTGSAGTPGGGGRIAVYFDPAAQSNVNPRASIRFGAGGGNHPVIGSEGQPGTIYLADPAVLSETIMGGIHAMPGFTSWASSNLTVGGYGYAVFPNVLTVAVSNDLDIHTYGGLRLTNMASFSVGRDMTVRTLGLVNLFFDGTGPSLLTVGRDLTVTNGAVLKLHSGPTNSSMIDHGTLATIGRSVLIYTNSSLVPYSEPTNGGSILFRTGTLDVRLGGSINANYTGFEGGIATNGFGPGGGRGGTCGGGGYGGTGGYASGAYGQTYGSSNAPVDPGSGGGGGTGLRGGGLIRVEATRMKLDGTLTASDIGTGTHLLGSASGGGIYLRCRYLEGNGALRANGGNHYGGSTGGCGGGGRIAVWSTYNDFVIDTNRVTVNGGTSTDPGRIGQPGTIVWATLALPGTIILLR